jgi:AcrR family transcriptional regulator
MPKPQPPEPAEPARRTQAARRAESERNLLCAAVEVIAQDGVAAATFERIGARAGYSRGLATQKFGSKQGLIEALIAHLHARLEALLREAHVEDLSGLEGVLTFADIFIRELAADQEVRAYMMLMAAGVADPSPTRAAFAASHDLVSERLQAILRRGQNDGSVAQTLPPEQAATLVGSMLLGLSTQHLVDPALDLPVIRAACRAALQRALAMR